VAQPGEIDQEGDQAGEEKDGWEKDGEDPLENEKDNLED